MTNHANHLAQHVKKPHLASDSTLHVVGVVSNPERFHSRYRHARNWLKEMEETPHVKAYVVEAAFGDRQHEITEAGHARHLQVRTRSQSWIKESMINLGVRHLLPADWKYMAWVDMDVHFRDPDWALEAMHQLQHFALIQPWETAADIGFRGRILRTVTSFGAVCQEGPQEAPDGYYGKGGHTGYAWACTRAFYERVGGLMDFGILGAGDWHMAYAAVGRGTDSANHALSGSYHRRIAEWQARALPLTHGEVGVSCGRIEHNFHGPRKNRHYEDRWQALVRCDYDPDTDLIWDEQGLVQLAGNKPELEQAIRAYNRSRFEDDTRDE